MIPYDSIAIAAGVILAAFGAITVIANGVKSIGELLPMAKLTDRVEKLESHEEDIDKKYDKLNKIINAQSRLLIEMTTHMITGNDIDKLQKKRDELTDAIIDEER